VIAYSSMAQMSLIVLGIFAANNLGVTGAILQSVAHGLVSAALRKETSPTPASPETGQTRHDAAAVLEPGTARYLSGLLDEIDRISSRQYGGGIEMLIDEHPSPEREQFLAALARGCEVTIGLGRGGTGAPDALLQKIIDLVRVIAAAELAKNPGLDLRDVSAVLGFASPSHLSTTSMRIAGTKPVSLTRLRTVDIVDRFVKGHGRSRA